jgi:hypothetical protein
MTSDSPPKAHRVFVSYVREDQETVERLAKELSAYGIKVWLDKTELKPGTRWRDAIREAISQGDFFIACFSEAYQRRSKSYMNEELTLAIEELRQRPTNRAFQSCCRIVKYPQGALAPERLYVRFNGSSFIATGRRE